MRNQLVRLSKRTKAERVIGEILKQNHIKFKSHCRIGKYEIDFLIKSRIVLEIDGRVHQSTNSEKDAYLFSRGYIPLHLSALNRYDDNVAKELLTLIRNNYG